MMRKKLIALAVAGAMDSPLIAQADVSIYHNYPLENSMKPLWLIRQIAQRGLVRKTKHNR